MPWLVSFQAYGEQFRPSQINYSFTESNDPGDIGKTGRYQNKPVPYGAIHLEVPKQIPNQERISYIVKIIQPLLPELKRAGATRWFLNIGRFYSTQCNESYSSEELALIASLNCPLNYSAYKVSKKREHELEKEFGGFEDSSVQT